MIKEVTFIQTLKKVMMHNNYESGCVKVDQCNKIGKWTPCDLILRAELSELSGSAMGFLGISSRENKNAFDYICANKNYFIEQNMVNKDGWNNWGFPLWKDYDFDR